MDWLWFYKLPNNGSWYSVFLILDMLKNFWFMLLWPADTTETVAEHSASLQPSINLHALVTAFYVQLLWYPMYYPRGMKWPWKGSVVVTAYDFESGRTGSNPEWGLLYYEASITAQGLPEPSSLRGSTLGTRAAEHKGCNWGMQVDWWLQPCAVLGHSFSGISWHMPQK